MTKTRRDDDERWLRARALILERAEQELARSENRDPRPLPTTDVEYREWRKPHVAHLERMRERLLAEFDDG